MVTYFEAIRAILVELLDLESDQIHPHSYLVRDLGVESIDFLELAVTLNEQFRIDVHDDTVFLRNLRLHLETAAAAQTPATAMLEKHYPYLSQMRIREILDDLEDGPVIQVRDVEDYVAWKISSAKAA